MDRNNIEKITTNPEDRIFLAKIWDKINAGIRKNIPANTPFLTPHQQELCQYLFGSYPGLYVFGGYPDAERNVLVFLPEYLTEESLQEESGIVCIEALFSDQNKLAHRDFLGAIMGLGITRETIGDIYVESSKCYIAAKKEIAPYILQNLTKVGRAHLKLQSIFFSNVAITHPKTKEIKDTVASTRLDSIVSSGFCISRSNATQLIIAGKASINGVPCEKSDKIINEGDKVSVRGHGKILLRTINGQTKKGRYSIIIDRYI